MAFAYLLDPVNQYQNRAGVNNVNGFFKVFRADTDDTATTYKDFSGTLNPERIPIDNNGRAVIIVESGRPYRVEMYLPNGSLEFTQYPVYPMASGGGLTMVNIESTDGSVKVDKTVVGGQATFDLSVNDADPQYLDWAKCALANVPAAGTMVPLKVQGTMDADEHGLVLKAGNLYHVTARFVATKGDAQPFYDNVTLMFKTFDGESDAIVLSLNRIIDYSLGLNQEFDVSADVKVGDHDVSLYFAYDGKDVNQGEIRFLTADIHKLFSGVPQLPEGVASAAWVSDHFQEKLEAGEGITIVGNVISATAQQRQQADWAEDDPEDVTFIRNKPSLATVATSGSYNDLSDKPSIPAAQVQSDWSEADSAAADYIKNKPNLATVATSGSYNDLQDKPSIPPAAQVQSDWSEADNTKADFIKNKPNLATVATSGSYNDLSDKPSIPAAQVQSDWNQADSGAVDYIKNKPTIPEGVPAYSTADADKILGVVDNQGTAVLDWVSKGGGGTQVQADWTEADSSDPSYIKNKPNLATVATSGSYNDLSDKPSIPAAQVQSDWTEADNTKADFIKNKPNLATVATSGSYNDLSDKPSIPAAQVQADWDEADSNAADYIKNKPSIPVVPPMKNLVAGTNVTITETNNGIEIAASGAPQEQADWSEQDNTKVDYIKNKPNLATVATSGSYNDLSDKPTINNVPAVTSTDDGKVLKASYSGGVGSYSWETGGGGGSSYTAGAGIDITNDVISWLNTAGITDIQMVNALPASPDAHTLYLTPDSGAQEVTLYSGMKSIGDNGSATYTLSESPLNFQYIKVYYCANGNVSASDWGTGGNRGVESVEWDTNLYRANNTHLHVQMNSGTGATFTQYNVSANLTGIRTTTWGVQGALNSATSNAAWFHIYKIVGRNRIANN